MTIYYHKPKKLADVTRDLAAVAMGSLPADLIIRNGNLVNVNIGCIQKNIDVAVKHGFIVYVGQESEGKIKTDDHTKIVDANGRYLVPGFIDSHVHIESSMTDPRHFIKGILPRGTTTICPDNHEITNVLGLKAVELFHQAAQGLPIKFLLAMPVCVPAVAGFENAGAEINAADVSKAYQNGWAQLQGEQMNFVGVIHGDEHVHSIIKASHDAGMILTGHYSSLELDQGLNAFAATGINCCHEVTTADSVLRRAELGFYSQLRYGSAWLDLPNTIKAYTNNPGIDSRFLTICTDDVNASTIVEEGQMDRAIRTAIRNGVPPITAIQMATLNPAQLLEKARWIGSIAPGRAADILIVSNLTELVIDEVYSDGVLVAKNGILSVDFEPYSYPEIATKTMYLDPLTPEDFKIPAGTENPVKIRAIEIVPGMVHTIEKMKRMRPVNGNLIADSSRDLAKAFVFYRHQPKETLKGSRGYGFVAGTKFNSNCAYASTVSHDCHNLLVVGTSDEAMALAANEVIQAGGGIAVVVNGILDAIIELPFAGLMSLEPMEVVAKKINAVELALKKAGCPYPSIEMTLSLLGLIVIEELHLSNQGLVELKSNAPLKFVDLIIPEE
jgi:adenine deaminase